MHIKDLMVDGLRVWNEGKIRSLFNERDQFQILSIALYPLEESLMGGVGLGIRSVIILSN